MKQLARTVLLQPADDKMIMWDEVLRVMGSGTLVS